MYLKEVFDDFLFVLQILVLFDRSSGTTRRTSNTMNATKVFSFLCGFFTAAGLWKPYHKSKFVQHIYSCHSAFFLLFTIVYTIPLASSIFLATDAQDLSNRLFISSTKIAMINKLIPIILYNKSFQRMKQLINDFQVKSRAEERLVGQRIDKFATIMYIFAVMPHSAISVWNIATILSEERRLTFIGWYPGFDWENDDHTYWTLFWYQYIGITITAIVNISIDLFYCFVMYATSVEFEILGQRLSLIEDRTSVCANKEHLIEHIRTLKNIQDLVDIINSKMSVSYFTQVISSAIVIFATIQDLAAVSVHCFLQFIQE